MLAELLQTSQQEKFNHCLSRWEIDTRFDEPKKSSLWKWQTLITKMYSGVFGSSLHNWILILSTQLKAFRDAIPLILTNWFLLWIGIWYQFKSASGSYLMNIFTPNKPAKESQKLFIRFRHWWHVFYYSPFSWLVKECRLFLFKLGDSFFESENFISLVLYAFFKESLIGTNFMPHKFPRGRHDFLCSLRWRDQEGTL